MVAAENDVKGPRNISNSLDSVLPGKVVAAIGSAKQTASMTANAKMISSYKDGSGRSVVYFQTGMAPVVEKVNRQAEAVSDGDGFDEDSTRVCWMSSDPIPKDELDSIIAAHFGSVMRSDRLVGVCPLPEHQQGATSRIYTGEDRDGTKRIIRLNLRYDEDSPFSGIMKHMAIASRTSVVPYVVSFEMVPLPDDVLRPACVLEHIEGETLESMMGDADAAAVTARYGSLELFKLALFRRVVSAVEELHAAGYVHNDLKPGNILIVDDGEGRLPYVRLIDLYSVLKIGAGQMPEKMNWTPGYAASEDLQPGCDEVRPARDIMKLGGLLYWLHTDRSPFHSTIVGLNKIPKEGRNAEILRRLRKSMQDESPFKDPPEDVRKRLEETSAYTAGVICKCMKMDPSERYQDCTELLAAVDRAMEYVALTRVFEDALGFESTRDSYPGHPVTPVPVVEDDGLGRLLMDTLDKAGR